MSEDEDSKDKGDGYSQHPNQREQCAETKCLSQTWSWHSDASVQPLDYTALRCCGILVASSRRLCH